MAPENTQRFKFGCLLRQVVELIRDDILPYATSVPSEFVVKIMNILNKGSIHSATSTAFIGWCALRHTRRIGSVAVGFLQGKTVRSDVPSIFTGSTLPGMF